MIHFAKCWTGRRWLNIGRGFLALGFGPSRVVERVMWRGRYVYPRAERVA